MQKIIKPSEKHYIIVNDSEDFTEKDWYYDFEQSSIRTGSNNHVTGGYKQKITHSTEPLGFLKEEGITTANLKYDWKTVKQLYLSEVEEAINGYSIEKMAFEYYEKLKKDYFSNTGQVARLPKSGKEFQAMGDGYIDGFNAHQELVKDKVFTIEDMKSAMEIILTTHSEFSTEEDNSANINSIIQSLLPKTEWDCCISDEQGKIKLI